MSDVKAVFLSPFVAHWQHLPVACERLTQWISDYLDEQLSWCHDEQFGALFPFQQLDLPQDFFLQRVIDVDGIQYLTGPRFVNQQLDAPFVDIIAPCGPPSERAVKAILANWQGLNATRVRYCSATITPALHPIDQQLYLGQASEMIAAQADTTVFLTGANITDKQWCRALLDDAYQQLFKRQPELQKRLHALSDDELEEHLQDGEVCRIHWCQQAVGVLIVQACSYQFLHGLSVIDKAIAPAFQGQHLSAKAQLAYMQQLASDALLFGTIDGRNEASIQSALQAGRMPVLRYCWMDEPSNSSNIQ
ncbi:hypothetical protein [Celerinatantimonas yamalensis]|uniref:N-acetyltransferase domain-containing protein n=1 Tax=Celerinatantimonas yamalensis TaxID=559956 RepID=A0ABW9G8G4_9GAMM